MVGGGPLEECLRVFELCVLTETFCVPELKRTITHANGICAILSEWQKEEFVSLWVETSVTIKKLYAAGEGVSCIWHELVSKVIECYVLEDEAGMYAFGPCCSNFRSSLWM